MTYLTGKGNRRRIHLIAMAAAVTIMQSAARADVVTVGYQFTGQQTGKPLPATTVVSNLTASTFGYVNANPSSPPFGNPPFIVQGGTLPDDPPYFISQGDWFPTADGFNQNYYTFSISVAPGFALNANTFSFEANSRQQVPFITQVQYSSSPSFSNPVSFDVNPIEIPTQQVWNTFTASDAPIAQGMATYYFRVYSELDPNGNGTISDLLNMGNFAVNGTVQQPATATNMYWDPGAVGTFGSGGAGSWLGGNTWADGAPDYSWSNTIPEVANFAGTAGGIVTLGGNVNARNGINFDTAGYVIAGSSGQTLTVGGSIVTNAAATISAPITTSSAGTLTVTGPAALTIAGTASFASGTTLAINNGALIVTSGGSVIANGADQDVSSITGSTATLTVQGSGSFATNGALNLGLQGNGILNVQDSSMVTATTLYVGRNANGSGAMGTVNQTGGTLTAASVILGTATMGFGTYNLSGGTLAAGSVSSGGGMSTFVFNGGTLQTTAAGSFFSGKSSLQVQSGGAVIDTMTNNVTLAASLTPSAGSTGGLSKYGTGTLTLNLPNSITGGVNVIGGTLVAAYFGGQTGTFAGASPVTIDSGAALQLNGTDSLGFFSGSPILNVDGGVVTTDGSASHSELGQVNLTGGTLTAVGSGDASGNYVLDATVNSLANSTSSLISATKISLRNDTHVGGTFNVAAGGGAVDLTISSQIASLTGETASLMKTGSGTLLLTNSNTYNGGTTVSGGMLESETYALPSPTISIASGAILDYNVSSRVFQNPATLSGSGTFRVNGSGTFVFGGLGNINVDFSPGALIDVESGLLTGSSSYGGIWTSNFASLNVAGGATFDAVEAGPTGTMQVDALTGSGIFQGGYFGNFQGLSTLTIGDANGGGTFSGALRDDGGAHLAIVKTGSGSEKFSGTNTYTGGTTVNGGTLVIGAASALPNAAVTISATGDLQLGHGIGAVTVPTLSVSGSGVVDVTNNPLFVHYGANADPIATISSYLTAGYKGGAWNGIGIDSSSVAGSNATQSALIYGVGYADGKDGVVTGLSSGTIEILPTLVGDAKLQGSVNFGDFQLLAANFGSSAGWDGGNFTYGSVVNFGDFQLLAQNFGATSSALSGSELSSINNFAALGGEELEANSSGGGYSLISVPEPASLGILGMAGMVYVSRRRRKWR